MDIMKICLIISTVSLILALLVLVLAIVFYLRIKGYLTDSITDKGFDRHGNIRDEIIDVVRGSSRIRAWMPKPQIINENVASSDGSISTNTFNFIVETVIADVLKKLEKSHVEEFEVPIEDDVNFLTKYASAYSAKIGSFYSIDDRPTENTIYEINVNEKTGEGVYTIYKKSYGKISECRDYLEELCEVSGNGANIEIISEGKLVLMDGRCQIHKRLEVKFI